MIGVIIGLCILATWLWLVYRQYGKTVKPQEHGFRCPKCGAKHKDNWPVTVNGNVEIGGCQECWEAECSEAFWDDTYVICEHARPHLERYDCECDGECLYFCSFVNKYRACVPVEQEKKDD